MDVPKTLTAAIAHYADPQRAFDAAVDLRWPGGNVTCPRCNQAKHSFIKTRRIWFCYVCKKQFTVKVGTIFEDSPLGLDKWMTAVWLIANCKNGISSYELGKALGVRQESAWFMLHRIRKAMQDDSIVKLSGEVEADETFIGGKSRNMHLAQRKLRITGTGPKDKIAVMGVLERGGKVRTTVVANRKRRRFRLKSRSMSHQARPSIPTRCCPTMDSPKITCIRSWIMRSNTLRDGYIRMALRIFGRC